MRRIPSVFESISLLVLCSITRSGLDVYSQNYDTHIAQCVLALSEIRAAARLWSPKTRVPRLPSNAVNDLLMLEISLESAIALKDLHGGSM
ncbi:hypothetical protein, partial [Novipirellula artificiosorum]|uniref:hypothetical protein n=1 Tax=Novipirellula artificiosorum TaxID=2528016 RepID=UPI001E611259